LTTVKKIGNTDSFSGRDLLHGVVSVQFLKGVRAGDRVPVWAIPYATVQTVEPT
jgi:hypothetical protein